ncbi:SAM-dependent methyltransferase [Paenibacillus favisporus]|uniref:SAM-dependent methyltransferase n=1 Tax=Paenibacillus favisporus TaxID=221028 RepID=A0ABV2F413_9BACL
MTGHGAGRDYVVTEIPVELLFTELDVRSARTDHLIESFTDRWYEHHLQYADISIMRFVPHRELYRYFAEEPGAAPDAYLDWYEQIHVTRGITPLMAQKELLNQRRLEYDNMQSELRSGPDFFFDHPVKAKWNPAGYFNVLDGHHRACFLYCLGFRRIPVRLPLQDYTVWLHSAAAAEVEQTMKDQQRTLIYTPILNPRFYDMHSERDETYPTRLDHIARFLGPGKLKGRSVLDIGCNIGYYARHFVREGADVTGVEPDPDHHTLLHKLNAMERTAFSVITERFEETEAVQQYDIGLLLTVFYHMMKDPEACRRFLAQLDRSVCGLLFWESGDAIESEKKLLIENTGFKHYEKLADTFGTGKYRELGVFRKA